MWKPRTRGSPVTPLRCCTSTPVTEVDLVNRPETVVALTTGAAEEAATTSAPVAGGAAGRVPIAPMLGGVIPVGPDDGPGRAPAPVSSGLGRVPCVGGWTE